MSKCSLWRRGGDDAHLVQREARDATVVQADGHGRLQGVEGPGAPAAAAAARSCVQDDLRLRKLQRPAIGCRFS